MRFLRSFKLILGGVPYPNMGVFGVWGHTLRYMGSLQPARMIRNGLTRHWQWCHLLHPRHFFAVLFRVVLCVLVVAQSLVLVV